MAKQRKKSTVLYVLELLKKGSSKKKPIAQTVIARAINLKGIKCDRKTIARDIDCLIEFGYDIVKVKGIGCYLNTHDFEPNEVALLIQGIKGLDNLETAEKVRLIKKVKAKLEVRDYW